MRSKLTLGVASVLLAGILTGCIDNKVDSNLQEDKTDEINDEIENEIAENESDNKEDEKDNDIKEYMIGDIVYLEGINFSIFEMNELERDSSSLNDKYLVIDFIAESGESLAIPEISAQDNFRVTDSKGNVYEPVKNLENEKLFSESKSNEVGKVYGKLAFDVIDSEEYYFEIIDFMGQNLKFKSK